MRRIRTLCKSSLLLVLAPVMFGCGEGQPTPDALDEGSNPFAEGRSFVEIPRNLDESTIQQRSQDVASLYPGVPYSPGSDFYLAIHKRELGEKFFLSAYLRDFFPGAVYGGAASTLGTRVVQFALQNGRLLVVDVDDRKQTSDIFDPDVLLEAFPVVNGFGPYDRLAGFKDYIVVDPAAGLGRFSFYEDITAQYFNPPTRFDVELSFLQNFRGIEDGITYEHLFTGYADSAVFQDVVNNNGFRGAGLLGVAIRRYQEGENYTPVPLPDQTHYFASDPFLVPNTGASNQVAARWDIHPGMDPIPWRISPLLAEVDADPRYADYDLVEAVRAGIENWNDAFGFTVFEAEVADITESFAEDDRNYLIFDTDPSVGFAFADWRTNPNTGEIRGASVYFGAGWLRIVDIFEEQDADTDDETLLTLEERPALPRLAWDAIPSRPLCVRHVSEAVKSVRDYESRGESLTTKEKVERFITGIISHEVGHTLSLRHNFKGSLVPPATSVMDYLVRDDMVAAHRPGSYDIAAVGYLYGLAPDLPVDPFCTDHQTLVDPTCVRFDTSADPLADGVRQYELVLDTVLALGIEDPQGKSYFDNYSDQLFGFVRAASGADATSAWATVSERIAPPMDPVLAADPVLAKNADDLLAYVYSLLYLDADLSPFTIIMPPQSAETVQAITQSLGDTVVNSDGLRQFSTRRVAVDVLEVQQSLEALQELRDARAQIEAELTVGGQSLDERALLEDLLARIEAAMSPYFDE